MMSKANVGCSGCGADGWMEMNGMIRVSIQPGWIIGNIVGTKGTLYLCSDVCRRRYEKRNDVEILPVPGDLQ